MADTPLSYDFLPWARRGLARAHAQAQALGQPALPAVSVGLQITGSGGAGPNPSAVGSIDLKMFGPADVIGIDPRVIVRTEPRRQMRNFEPNYLAAIEFDPPDFPWMLTPARANAQQRLAPWLVLVVLRDDEIEGSPALRPGRVLASVSLRAGAPVPLPELTESWMWAHAQLVRDPASPDVAHGLRHDPARNLSRLVCPRRLEPDVNYVACLVPAFDAGVKAGLGQPVAANAVLGPAWPGSEASGIELPVYYSWEFSTGPAGDFETLARRLRCPADYENDASVAAKLAALGRIAVEVDADRLLQRGAVTPAIVESEYVAQYQGALLSLDKDQPPPEPGRSADIAALLASALTAGDKRTLGNLAQLPAEPEVPLVGPPSYGVWHARRHSLVPSQRSSHWVDGLNLSLPNRMAAGVGTRLVQTHQEELMQAAWAQVGTVLEAARLLSRAHLSMKALQRAVQRIELLPPVRRLQLLAPCSARTTPGKLAPGLTLWGYGRSTSLPERAFDGALRRGLSPVRGLLRRSLAARAAPQVATQLVGAFASPRTAQPLVAGERFRADGFASLAALDAVQVPTDPGALVALPGFVAALPVAEVKRLIAQRDAVRRVNRPGAWRSPSVSAKTKGGVLLDSHWSRLGQLASALSADQLQQSEPTRGAGATPVGQMARSVRAAARAQPEGVLVSAVRGEQGYTLAPAQGLMIDARNGNLALGKGRAPRVGRRGGAARPMLAAAMKPGQVAAVDIASIRRFGNAALFESLPPGVVQGAGGDAPTVAVQASATGLFREATPVLDVPRQPSAPGSRQSITLLPPERREAVLDRFRGAWSDKLAREAPPKLPPRVTIGVVAFDVDQAAQAASAAIDVARLVPKRVSSLLDIGGARLDLLKPADGVVGHSLIALEKYVLSVLLDRVMAYPKIDEPLYRRLVEMDRDAFMPGAEDIPNDTILLTATNPRFVESFLVGSNHEMNRELLWRGFPTDQRGTPFQKFWPYFDRTAIDIQPIHQWNQSLPIGKAGGAQGSKSRLALLVRGELLRRYPNTNIYAIEKANDAAPAFSGTSPGPQGGPRETKHPIGGGLLPPDITFFLFDIDPEKAASFWWVLEEPMTEPRFGFDDQEQPREVPRLRVRGGQLRHAHKLAVIDLFAPENAGESWLDVDWAELPGVGAAGNKSRHVRLQDLTAVRLTQASLQLAGNAHAGQVARAMLQRPFRGYFAGARLE